jgi:hypothetical protein
VFRDRVRASEPLLGADELEALLRIAAEHAPGGDGAWAVCRSRIRERLRRFFGDGPGGPPPPTALA